MIPIYAEKVSFLKLVIVFYRAGSSGWLVRFEREDSYMYIDKQQVT